MNKYLLIDDVSGLIIGKCTDIIGLSGSELKQITDNHYDITLVGLRVDEAYILHCLSSKSKITISGFNLNILGKDGKGIGSYCFFPHKLFSFPKNANFQEKMNLALSGGFSVAPSYEAMKIWKKWMIAKPTVINTWAGMSQKQRLGWSEVVRLHSRFNTYRNNDAENEHFYLDMTHVTDILSFYCALGEAMNGPGGYYGFCLDSVEDCFYGGFGAKPPFHLHFRNRHLDELICMKNVKRADLARLIHLKDMFIAHQVTLV
ncbi:barstar family protein [Paenibacillus contaminans]|uniref:Uncharacterized protein n=1 Tax=Paenibacillus contaminans TaxID=450362 RepID=A0A329M066_9BACL|nr:barstar family protein [Paenibacillus contaminans]RAV12952.1 hypothetical protein DQG23_33770 [Paenibacillus contaminans]